MRHPAERSRTHSSVSSAAIKSARKRTHLFESVDTHQRITSAALGLSDRGIPLDVAEHIVNRSCRIELPAPAIYNRYIAMSVKKGRRLLDPASDNFAITIDKLDIARSGSN